MADRLLLRLAGAVVLLFAADRAIADCQPARLIPMLMEGDLIFRSEGGAASRIFSALGADRRYAHGGMVLIDAAGDVSVAHAFSRSWLASETTRADSAEAFLAQAATVGVYRAVDAGRARAAAARARRAVRLAIPFDRRFDLEDRTAMYCTELLWWAYSLDHPDPSTAGGLPRLLGRQIIPVAFFTRSKAFREVATCGDRP